MAQSNRNSIDSDPNPEDRLQLTCGECGRKVLTREMTLTGEGVRCDLCMIQLNARTYRANASPSEQTQVGQTPPPQSQINSTPPPPPPFQSEPPVINVNVDTTYCARHPKVETSLKCSKCGTPICPRCMVYSPVGLRCPEHASNPQPSTNFGSGRTTQSSRATPFSRPRAVNSPHVPPKFIGLAVLAAIGTAVVLSLVWGFFLNANITSGRDAIPRGVLDADYLLEETSNVSNLALITADRFAGSIHLLPEIVLGVLVGEAIGRVTRERRGRPLQIIAVLGVLLGIYLTFVVLAARIYLNGTNTLPPLGTLFGDALTAVGQMFTGDVLYVPILWGVAAFFSWLRLKA